MISPWQHDVRHELRARRGRSLAWGYRSAHAASVEPTVMACLALIATSDQQTAEGDIATGREAARWLVAVQRSDGSVPAMQGLDSRAGWSTPHAILLWSALSGYESPSARARNWLLAHRGEVIPLDKSAKKVVGHDSRLVGWPWIDATHSWLEPTALAILALCRLGLAGHPRVRAGTELIMNRALDSGGWNYGNKSVFGTELRPQPGPTGLALLALAAASERGPAVTNGLAYLHATVGGLRAPLSLGWAILGLRAFQACPNEADSLLAQACQRSIKKADAAMGLALALQAASDAGLILLIDGSSNQSPSPSPRSPQPHATLETRT